MERAVVTGLGCLSVLGENASQFWTGLNSGKSGVLEITGFSREHLRNPRAGEIKTPPQLLEYARQRGLTSRISLFAHWSVEEALKDSGLSKETLKDKKVGLVLGVSLGMSLITETLECDDASINGPDKTHDDLSDFMDEVAETFGIRGETILVTTACASGANAIGIAKDMIRYEGYDTVICGGVDTLDRMKYLGHTALSTLTPTSVKPFTANRDGTLFGEGAGILILEKSSALTDQTPYAICSGTGYSCDAIHPTAPDETGAGACYVMREALHDAGVKPEEVGYVNLHGSGTLANDSMEGLAIQDLFGPAAQTLPVSSIKPAIGHTMGAAGALEAVATVLAVRHQKIPPTMTGDSLGLAPGELDESPFPLRIIRRQPLDIEINHALNNAFGFGGCNGAVLFSRMEQ